VGYLPDDTPAERSRLRQTTPPSVPYRYRSVDQASYSIAGVPPVHKNMHERFEPPTHLLPATGTPSINSTWETASVLDSFQSHDIPDSQVYHVPTAVSVGETSALSEPTPRSMKAGRGAKYTSAVTEFVERVCGENSTRPEPNRLLIDTYFSWQCPQHMPIDEQLFRREYSHNPHVLTSSCLIVLQGT
jgi:hypothetical protein